MNERLAFPDAVPRLDDGVVTLRALDESDIPAWFARATDVVSAELAGDPVPESIAAGTAWLALHRQRFRDRIAIRWAITSSDAEDSIGSVGLAITSTEARTADIGLVIARAYWSRGIATAAARLALRYAFDTLGIATVNAEVLARNHASIRVLEKLGFRRVPANANAAGGALFAEDGFAYALHAGAGPR